MSGPPQKLSRPVNAPGLPELRYRVGTFDGLVEEMLDRLTVGLRGPIRDEATAYVSRADSSEPTAPPRRIRVHLDGPDHWLVALVKSWATVADVLTFYQERIVNEGYLRTAQESRSIHELVQMISYHPRPGVAGSAELAITLADIKGLPEMLSLSPGLVIRSIPPPGAEPQVFETVSDLQARVKWNLLRPEPVPRKLPPLITGASTGLGLDGTGSGLTVGSGVLIMGGWKGGQARFFRQLTEVKIVAGAGGTLPSTEIAWTVPLDAASPEVELTDPQVFALRQQTGLFGQNAPQWEELSPQVRQQTQTLEGGVMLSGDAGWVAMNQGLPATTSLRCAAVDPTGNLFVGTTDGIFRSLDGGVTWKLVRRGLQQMEVLTLAAGPRGSLYAGTSSGGVYRSTDSGEIWELANGTGVLAPRSRWSVQIGPQAGPLPATTVRSLVVTGWNDHSTLYAGTDSGVYQSGDAGRSWLPVNRGFPGTNAESGVTDLAVDALAIGPEPGLLFAGTARGVFKSTNGGRRWQPINRGIPATDPFTTLSSTEVCCVGAWQDRRRRAIHLLAGTTMGLFRSVDGGEHWLRTALPEETHGIPAQVLSLLVVDDPITLVTRLYVGTGQGLWVSSDHGLTWTPVPLRRPARVEAIAAGPAGVPLVIATPFAGFSNDWPDFRLHGRWIDLDSVVPGVVPGSWVVLRSGHALDAAADPTAAGIFQVARTQVVQRRDFSLAATVTRIEVREANAQLGGFDLRQTRAWVQSEQLPLRLRIVKDIPQATRGLRDALVALGEPLRKLIVTGRAATPVLTPLADPVIEPADLLGLTILAGDLALALDSPTRVGGVDAVHLRSPVSGEAVILEAESLKVYGNVVEAMEGVTVAGEVLGGGDASQANQSFTLAQPLTFRRAPAGPEAALQVEVQRQLWKQVQMLKTEDGDSRSYRLRLDADSRATVTFGDGESGARLPSGTDNVVATYRTGMTFRTVPAGGLSLLASRPLGLESLTNPMESIPGAPAEGPDEVRRAAPRTVRALGRIVSLRDYEDFAQGFPGVAKAGAWKLLVSGSPAVQITVAGPGGDRISDGLAEQLREAIDASRAHPMPVYIQSYQRVPIAVTAGVQIDPRFRWDDVKRQIEAMLQVELGFAASRFGGAVSAATVVSLIQALPTVISVDLDEFSWPGMETDSDPAVDADRPWERRALPPSWNPRTGVQPAELVLLAPPLLSEIGAR